MRELELTGDHAAAKKIEEYGKILSGGRSALKQAMAFESSVIDAAKNEFELISELEHRDLERIYEDRHACAHPSMKNIEEIYQPSAEIVRAHLFHAVEHMLSKEPVQGKSALDKILNNIQ